MRETEIKVGNCQQCDIAIQKESGGIYRDVKICVGPPKCPNLSSAKAPSPAEK